MPDTAQRSHGSREISTVRVIDAVCDALHHDLADGPGHGEFRTHLLRAADVLLHRAVLEELQPIRRAAAAAELAKLLAPFGPDSDDPFRVVERMAPALVTGAADSDCVVSIVRLIAETDLPELGLAASPERAEAEAIAANWLGLDAPPLIKARDVSDYLADHSPLAAGSIAGSVRQLSGGFSKTTILVSVERPGHPVEEIVLRQVPFGRDRHTLTGEFNIVRFAGERGIAVPEPLWIEPADNRLGGPFFASRRVNGANVGDVFGPQPGTGPEVSLGLARALASLHSLSLEGVPATPVTPMTTRAEILTAIDQQQDLARTAAAADVDVPHPLHNLLFAWLREHAPADVARPVLLHGDPGFHNMLVHEGEVRALLDWERARLGDAAQDLAYVRPHVIRVHPWEEFLAEYCAAGGVAPDEEQLRYYSVWHDAWRFTGAYRGRGRLLSQPSGLLAAVTGLLHAPRFLLSGLQIAYEVEL